MIDVCNMQQIRELLSRYGFHFSKAKGQNFLNQRWVPERIAAESGVDASCGVLEIGPGFGSLTQALCARAGKVVALEVDTSLAPVLAETMADFDNLELRFTDALKADLPALVQEKFAGLRPLACANLPYYITSPVLTKLLESRCFDAITVMVQKEVAQRICAEPGTAAYSAFSIYVQYHAKAEILFDVPADCFVPRPKVDSAVLKLVPLDKPAVETKDEKLFFSLVRAAFNMRRKTLVNALGPVLGSSMSKEEITALVEAAGLDARVRGERLSLAEYAKLADLAVEKLSN